MSAVRSTSVWALVAAEVVSILGTREHWGVVPVFALVAAGITVTAALFAVIVLTHREDEPAAPVEVVAA